MDWTETSREELFEIFGSLRNVARNLIHARAKRVGPNPIDAACRLDIAGFRILHWTPFNPWRRCVRNQADRLQVQMQREYPYQLMIVKAEYIYFHVGWGRRDDDDLYVHWFSEDPAWHVRFLERVS
jgi:hypothetical protein